MSITVASIITECKERYDITDARCLALINEAHNELLSCVPFVTDTETITLTGAETYTLDADIVKIWVARYVETSGDKSTVDQISIRELDMYHDGWRDMDEGTPQYVATETNSTGALVFRTIPVASGIMELIVSRNQTLNSGSSLPSSVDSMSYYKYYVWEKVAEMKDLATAPYWQKQRQSERARLFQKLSSIHADVRAKITPFMGQSGGRV